MKDNLVAKKSNAIAFAIRLKRKNSSSFSIYNSQFFSFVRKEFYHVFRDKKTLLLLFGMPIAQIILFGFALTNEIKNSKTVICDYARDVASQQIATKIEASKYFDIDKNLLDYKQIDAAFKSGKIKLAIVF